MNRSAFIIFLMCCVGNGCATDEHEIMAVSKVFFPEQGVTFNVELAQTSKQRSLGLMNRSSLPKNHGVLFLFEAEGIQRVWMKNTLIALDVIFISKQGRVVSLLKALKPCAKSECDIFESGKLAKYMLEINAGGISRENIRVGQQVLFNEMIE